MSKSSSLCNKVQSAVSQSSLSRVERRKDDRRCLMSELAPPEVVVVVVVVVMFLCLVCRGKTVTSHYSRMLVVRRCLGLRGERMIVGV